MKYFMDCEFIEGTQKKRTFFGSIKETKPTIDLISIGIVSEDGREYYAISKDFNLKEAWNRYQWKHQRVSDTNTIRKKEYWIRDNILKSIFCELAIQEPETKKQYGNYNNLFGAIDLYDDNFKSFERLINKYGKTNKEIAEEIKDFVGFPKYYPTSLNEFEEIQLRNIERTPEFYTYYGAYDWVVFCWLFGRMIDLPNGFPMFSRDLKVMLDNKINSLPNARWIDSMNDKEYNLINLKSKLNYIKSKDTYPKQDNEHNALDDAKWNLKLYEFIKNL